MALRQLINAETKKVTKSSVAHLYRACVKEIPRVLLIYDVDMPHKEAREVIKYHFRKHSTIKDSRIIGILIAKGYMELEETLMQWKQKTHLLRILEPLELQQQDTKSLSAREKFILGLPLDK